MKTILLLLLITLSEATIGVFVKLTDGRIPIQTLNFYAILTAAAFLILALPVATGRPIRLPWGNLKDTIVIGVLIATQISVFNYAMTLVPIANAVIFWSVAPTRDSSGAMWRCPPCNTATECCQPLNSPVYRSPCYWSAPAMIKNAPPSCWLRALTVRA